MKKILIAALMFTSMSSYAAHETYQCEARFEALWDREANREIPGTREPFVVPVILTYDSETLSGMIKGSLLWEVQFQPTQDARVIAGFRKYFKKDWTVFLPADNEIPYGELRMFSADNKSVKLYKCFKK